MPAQAGKTDDDIGGIIFLDFVENCPSSTTMLDDSLMSYGLLGIVRDDGVQSSSSMRSGSSLIGDEGRVFHVVLRQIASISRIR